MAEDAQVIVGRDAAPPPPPRACDGLAAEGVWENVTPPEVRAQLPGPPDCIYGVGAFVIDPNDGGTIYLGTCTMGVWKSIDCGASWVQINTGRNGAALDGGRQWTFQMDPRDPQVLYANSGYGSMTNGLLKSTNGGVDWEIVFPPSDPALRDVVEYGFVGGLQLDPTNPDHLLLSFHARCRGEGITEACFGESMNGGETWRYMNGDPSWAGGEGTRIYFIGDSQTLLFGSESNGLWRSTDGGAHWQDLGIAQNHSAGALYRASTGVYYLGGPNGIVRSEDGIAWTQIPDSGNLISGLIGNGTTMYAIRGFPWGPGQDPYYPLWSALESDDSVWTHRMDTPMLTDGGSLAYDAQHRILYSSNRHEGFYRVVLP